MGILTVLSGKKGLQVVSAAAQFFGQIWTTVVLAAPFRGISHGGRAAYEATIRSIPVTLTMTLGLASCRVHIRRCSVRSRCPHAFQSARGEPLPPRTARPAGALLSHGAGACGTSPGRLALP